MEFRLLIGAVVQLLIHAQLVGAIAILTHTALEVLHVAATIAKQIFRHLEVIGQALLIVVQVCKYLLFSTLHDLMKLLTLSINNCNCMRWSR